MRKLKEAGVYQMTSAEYHADPCETPSLSSGVARTLVTRSALHAWTSHPRLNPHYENEEREAFDLGSAAHALLLEGENRMVVLPYTDYRKKDAQEARDAARADGKHPILEDRYPKILAMREAALRAIADCEHFQGKRITDGRTEESMIWIEEGGAVCRIRPDWYCDEISIAFDYKTTESAAPVAFSRQISRMGYDFQDAFYSRGIRRIFGREPTFLFMAQELEAPYACSFHGCAPSLKEPATGDVRRAIRMWEICLAAGKWPSYDQRVHFAEATTWQAAEALDRELVGIPYQVEKLWEKKPQGALA